LSCFDLVIGDSKEILILGETFRRCKCKEYLKCDERFVDYFICFECKLPLNSGERSLFCDACLYALCSLCSERKILNRPSRLIFSAHGDTCFSESFCHPINTSQGTLYFGQVDNFAGVYALLSSYFGGSTHEHRIQYHITYGEEKLINGLEYAGAREVIATLEPDDMVVVIDVTGIASRSLDGRISPTAYKGALGHVVFEKVLNNQQVLNVLKKLSGQCVARNGIPIPGLPSTTTSSSTYTYETWDWCEDPQASCDESDIYRKHCQNTVFLGVPTQGGHLAEMYHSDGDYNEGAVFCWKKDIEAVSVVVKEMTNIFIEHYPCCPVLITPSS
jgi:hypothetical protein